MRLQSDDGSVIVLRPVGYQFPDYVPRPGGFDNDANWLQIAGDVTDVAGPSWSFEDPCMDTREAREMSSWLRGVASGGFAPVVATPSGCPTFWLTEPNLSVELTEESDDHLIMRWRFSQESSPPGSSDEIRFGLGHGVRVTASREAVLAAAGAWDADLQAYPER